MEGIRKFDNQEFGEIRVAVGNDGEPWFVAKDVCDALGIRTDTVRSIVEADDVTEITNPNSIGVTHGRAPLIISEAGLYMLVLKSRKPEARAFKRWVTHEVLPAIRRDGAYVASDGTEDDATLMARALIAAQRTIASRDERIARQQACIGALEPKAGYFDACMDGERWSSFTEAARMLRQYDGGMTRKRLFELAQADGIITRDKQASRVGIDRGYVRNYQPPAYFDQTTGEMVRPRPYAKVTGKGLSWMVRRYCEGAIA